MKNGILKVRIVSVGATERPVAMRLPFQFGDTVVTQTAEAFVRVVIAVDGKVFTGQSAQLMVPRWFDKRTDQTNQDTVETLRISIKNACRSAVNLTGSAARICGEIQAETLARMPPETPRLAAGFGPALVEMAMIDAVCLACNVPFFEGARLDVFGLAERGTPDLDENLILQGLSSIRPQWKMRLRHTVGFDAPLSAKDASNMTDVAGPVTLQDVIETTGINAFKIKLKGDVAADLKRLAAIQPFLADTGQYQVSLDANEQYSKDAFIDFLSGFRTDPAVQGIRAATLFVEQPFDREIARQTVVSDEKFDLPLMIDESDDSDDSFARAWDLGWRGTSVKSCKSVFRALLNFCRICHLQSKGHNAFLSGEDLTCQPGLCLQQDTLMGAVVGVQHAERNGHHFAGGMQGASPAEISTIVREHGDLYRIEGGKPQLHIQAGQIAFSSLNAAGFGGSAAIDVTNDQRICHF